MLRESLATSPPFGTTNKFKCGELELRRIGELLFSTKSHNSRKQRHKELIFVVIRNAMIEKAFRNFICYGVLVCMIREVARCISRKQPLLATDFKKVWRPTRLTVARCRLGCFSINT